MRSVPRRAARAALVESTLRHLSSRGPVAVLPKEICEELGLSKALVNYHFGSRSGLVAEAMVLGSRRHLDELCVAVEAASADPAHRLFAWVESKLAWAVDNPGLVAALDFVDMVSGADEEFPADARAALVELGAQHHRLLTSLVAAARSPGRTGSVADDVAAISWLVSGAAVAMAAQGAVGLESPGVDTARRVVRATAEAILDK